MPPTRRSGGGRRSTRAAAYDPAAAWEPVFHGDDNIIQGEVLVTLSPSGADSITESIPLHPVGPAGSNVRSLGVDDLDSVLADLGAYDIVRLAPSSTGMAPAGAVRAASGLLEVAESDLSRSFRIRISSDTDVEEAAARIAEASTVENAEPNRWREASVTPNDPDFANQWGLSRINAPAAWDRTTGSPSVTVAVVDSGCDLDHPELASLLVPGFDMVDLGPSPVADPGWRFEGDFNGRDPIPEDEVGHGTHVAGTIACLSNNGVAVAGVNWQTKIMPIKALTRIVNITDGRVRGVGSSADIAAAIRHAADNGAHIINMSLGSNASVSVEASAVAYAISKGLVVVAAMGNDGTSNPSFPAAYPGVVAVGAIDSADHKASFSQTGSHIDVAAPGVDIWSTYLNGGTAKLQGTSMASPHVAGLAALIKAAKPSATGTEIADILRTTARPLRDNPTDPVPNNQYGYGCIDAKAAVDKAMGPAGPPITLTPLRTPVLPCFPRTPLVAGCVPITMPPACPPPQSVWQPWWCPPPSVFPPRCPPVAQPGPPVPTVPGAGFQQGYDPYGVMGGGAAQQPAAQQPGVQQPAAEQPSAPAERSYEAGYAAGYAAGTAEVQQAAAAQTPGALPFPPEPQVLRSPIVWCPPWTLNPRLCIPRTPFCPAPPWTWTWPSPPPPPPWGVDGPGQQFGGFDPYGQSPFQG
jgi:subtilisin family serine protease